MDNYNIYKEQYKKEEENKDTNIEETKNEINGFEEISIFKDGVTL